MPRYAIYFRRQIQQVVDDFECFPNEEAALAWARSLSKKQVLTELETPTIAEDIFDDETTPPQFEIEVEEIDDPAEGWDADPSLFASPPLGETRPFPGLIIVDVDVVDA